MGRAMGRGKKEEEIKKKEKRVASELTMLYNKNGNGRGGTWRDDSGGLVLVPSTEWGVVPDHQWLWGPPPQKNYTPKKD